MEAALYPDPQRLWRLMHKVQTLFEQCPVIARLFVFGSLARRDADRWSDLDMLVVTQRSCQFRAAFDHLRRHTTILHHNPFTLNTETAGGHVLGIIWAGESVFHCLDLNFLTMDDLKSAESLRRFGEISVLIQSDGISDSPPYETVNADAENADNTRIYGGGIHFTKKAIKKLIRQRGTPEEVRQRLEILKTIMHDYPADFMVPSGAIGQLAHTYIAIAEHLLQETS